MSGERTATAELDLPDVVRRLADAMLDGTSPDVMWRLAAREIRDLFGCDGVVSFERVESDRLLLRADTMSDQATSPVLVPFAPDSQAAYVLSRSEPVISPDLSVESRFTPGAILLQRGFRSSVSCRIGRETEPLGLIGAFSVNENGFDASHGVALQVLASALGVGVIQHRRTRSLQLRATVDSLTGIANRPTIVNRLEEDLARPVGRRVFSHVVMIDLDGFKAINDVRGHGAGDEVLRSIAHRLESVVGQQSVVGRLGGDEFLVLVRSSPTHAVMRLSEQLIGVMEQDIELSSGAVVGLSGSVGVAELVDSETSSNVLRRVDASMYDAKQAGRGLVRLALNPFSNDVPGQLTAERSEFEKAFDLPTVEAAIASVSLHLQPVVAVGSLETVGCAAVARGPAGSALELPRELFSQAATFGRLVELELAVKRLAFETPLPRQLGMLVKIDPAVFVNVAAMDRIVDAWRSSPLRNKLFVEVSVRSAAARPTQLLEAIRRVRALGWGLALDDYGHSHETLAVLRVAKPDVVKLDQSLTRPSGRHMVGPTMVALADHRQGSQPILIAKAVETPEQLELAAFLGADMMEGYQFGGPYSGALPVGPESPLKISTLDASRWETRPAGAMVGSKAQLLDLSRYLESFATTPDAVVLACLQRVNNYTARTRRQYAALARRAALVGVVGVNVGAGIEKGVRLGSVPEWSDFSKRWEVVVLSSTVSVALLAEEVDPVVAMQAGPTERSRRFAFRLTTDRAEVEQAAKALLATM